MTTHTLSVRAPRTLALVCGAALTLLGVGLPASAQPVDPDVGITREGEGARRATLNTRERKPFPAEVWNTLSEWQNGPALTQATTDGRVVLIATWTDYVPATRAAVRTATRLAEKHGKNGLTVVLVHAQQEWAGATKPKAPNDQSPLLVAWDQTGAFRQGLSVDNDPDFYLIDRAGQLRFADVPTDAVERAVDMLIAENADDARTINERVAADAQRAAREAARTSAINTEADLTNIPVLQWEQPPDTAYDEAKWPPRPREGDGPDAKEKPANPITLPETGWLRERPDLRGKAVLVYVWHPRIWFSFYEVAQAADVFQRQNRRDVVVVGIISNFQDSGNIRFSEEDRDPVKVQKRLEEIFNSRAYEHFLAMDLTTNAYTTASGESTIPLPGWVIMSSDGRARWWMDSKNQVGFERALADVLRNDPGIIARRAAEDAWLRTQRQGGAGTTPTTPATTPATTPPAGGG